MAKYLTAPRPTTEMPGGIPCIIGNEAAERFSFYGMKAILFPFMTKFLLDSSGNEAVMEPAEANFWIHIFNGAVYCTPLAGAILADRFFGKYRIIVALSIVYCLGHLALALDETRMGLLLGLTLIAVGAGGIKPCVSAHVGDQFGRMNAHRLSRVFGWFYLSINMGAFISSLLTPYLLYAVGPWIAFGTPGVLMILATIVFWMGRRKFIHVPAAGPGYVRETFTGEGIRAILRLSLIFYVFVAMFWALFDQHASSWVEQAEKMDRTVFGMTFEAAQFQAVNPFFILLLVPFFSYVVYPALNRVFKLTDLRKVMLGLFVAVPSFLIPAWVETRIDAGEVPTIWWQVLSYFFLTAAEVMVSITALEFAYTQAPQKMKSLVMSFYLLSVTVGNWFAALVIKLVRGEDSVFNLTGPEYFLFFAGAMLTMAVLFIPVAFLYKPRHYLQDDGSKVTDAEADVEMH